MRDILELQETIERQRSRVNAMIEHGIDDEEEFFYENRRLDQLIEQYIELEDQKRTLEIL